MTEQDLQSALSSCKLPMRSRVPLLRWAGSQAHDLVAMEKTLLLFVPWELEAVNVISRGLVAG